MKKFLVFDLLQFDRQELTGESTFFFKEEFSNSKSVRDYVEDEITDWILDNKTRRNFFISKFFDDPYNILDFRRLEKPFTPERGKPGDIDILLFNPSKLSQSIAFECKRVKVQALNEDESKINGAHNISEGIIQANKYIDLGFSKVYLVIYLLHDGRQLKTPSTFHRMGKGDSVEKLYNIPLNEGLKEEVGIVFIEIYQNTDKEIDLKYGIGICVDKAAKEREQHTTTTEKLIFEIRKAASRDRKNP
jgi:hypothetical protein